MKDLYIERARHAKQVQELNPPVFEADTIDFTNRKHSGYIINDSSEYQDENSVIRTLILLVVILAIVFIGWRYSNEINYVLQGGAQ